MNTQSLNEIKDVLREARYNPHYSMGSPQAIDHLLMHVVYAIEAILDGPDDKDKEANNGKCLTR